MRANSSHIHAALLRAIAGQAGLDAADREKPILVVEAIVSTDWASATFVGARHQLKLRIDGDADAVSAAMTSLAAGLPEREIIVPGHIVAEINVVAGGYAHIQRCMIKQSLTVNALTIVD